MLRQTWLLTDADQDLHEHDFQVAARDVAGATGAWRLSQRTLQGGLRQGVDLVEIDNGRMRLFIVPTRGMGIWRAEISDGKTLGWKSPVCGPVHPSFVPLNHPSGLGWLEGFDELLVRCGLESNGAPEFGEQGQLCYPLHGRIANRPARHVSVTVDEEQRTIRVSGIVEETRFHFQKLRLEATVTTQLDSNTFTISDRVTNFGGTDARMQMLYHINIGEPLLNAGSQIVAPLHQANLLGSTTAAPSDWKEYGPPVAGAAEQCLGLSLNGDKAGQTRVLLKNADGDQGVAVGFNSNHLPYFTLWKNLVASEDGYVTGLEPATNFPNCHSDEAQAGRVVSLTPNETWAADLTIDWFTNEQQIQQEEATINNER